MKPKQRLVFAGIVIGTIIAISVEHSVQSKARAKRELRVWAIEQHAKTNALRDEANSIRTIDDRDWALRHSVEQIAELEAERAAIYSKYGRTPPPD